MFEKFTIGTKYLKEIQYLVPPRDLLNDCLDVFDTFPEVFVYKLEQNILMVEIWIAEELFD